MHPLRGILYKLLSVTLMMVMAALIKATADVVPPGEAVFIRSVIGLPVVLVWLAAIGQLKGGIRVVSPIRHVMRGLSGTVSMGLNFAAFGLLPLPEVQAIAFLTPVLIVVFAALLLGERLRLFRTGAVALGLLGVLIVVWPRLAGSSSADAGGTATLGVTVAVLGAVLGALSQIQIRQMAGVERTAAIVFWFLVMSAVLSLLTIPFGWAMPDARAAMMLVLAGIAGGLGQILLTTSYRHADAAVIAPFEYFSMLVAVALGWFFFDEVPTLSILGGAALVIAAGGLIIWREHRLGLERNRQRAASTPHG